MLDQPAAIDTERELLDYYQQLASQNTGPLWTALRGASVIEPKSKAVPHVWRWQTLRPLLFRAGELVSMPDAQRRVLRLLNPGLPERRATTNTLFAGIQLVLPGEVAPSHRHTPAALRFVIEGEGGYTTVNGERIPMYPGDLVLTPNWTWHDHWNNTNKPMVWLDGLDLVLVELLEANFQEPFGEDRQPVTRPLDVSLHKYGAGAFRPAWERHEAPYSPLWHYPWQQTRAALEHLAEMTEGSPYDGVILEYMDPASGGPVMPTIACHIQLLKPGQRTQAHRHTASAIYHVVEGEGYSIVDGQRLNWERKDVFCIPGWTFHEHGNASATEPAILFSYTEAPVLRALQLYREEAYPGRHQSPS